MTNDLNLNSILSLPPHVVILSAEDCPAQNRITLNVDSLPEEQVCPLCGSRRCSIKGTEKPLTLRHLSSGGRSVFIRYTPQRFMCADCHAAFKESASWIHSRLQMTEALFIEICLSLTENVSIRSIAKKERVPEYVVQHVLGLSAAEHPAELPEVLYLFDFKANVGTWNPDTHSWDMYSSLCGIADGATGELLDILPEASAARLISCFGSYTLDQLRRVRYVVCGLGCSTLSAAVTGKCFPAAIVGIEPTHVAKRLNAAMNRIRVRILSGSEQQDAVLSNEKLMLLKDNARLLVLSPDSGESSVLPVSDNRLSRMLDLFPDIREMYGFQKEFRDIIQGDDLPDAVCRDFEDWLRRASASGVPEIRDAALSLGHWHRYILNGLQFRSYSTDCRKIMHTIRKFRRISGGTHSFVNMRNRLLLICGPIHRDGLSNVGSDTHI